ncbi:MAG: hypothetical protein M3Q33_08135 [Acidobacteriota bacterium]|nr:hypothetical protein [Acidobacteriota bacterium]
MNKFILLMLLVFASAIFSNIQAQLPGGGTPAGAGDSSLRNDDIRLRSIELERIKREAAKSDPNAYGAINPKIEAKFSQIKEDFENIQISEAAIIKAYKMSKEIDYKLISSSANDINKKSKRLDTNLFLYKVEPDETVKTVKKEDKKALDIKDLIINLDKAMGEFVTSKIFLDHKTIDAAVAKKARMDLANILKASEMLAKEAGKMK